MVGIGVDAGVEDGDGNEPMSSEQTDPDPLQTGLCPSGSIILIGLLNTYA